MSFFELAKEVLELREKIETLTKNNKMLRRALYAIIQDDKKKTIQLEATGNLDV